MAIKKNSAPLRVDAAETRQKLIAAGLELFAERGIDGVRSNEITRKAGASNTSAIQYHFGDKDGLVDAILDEYECMTKEEARKYMESDAYSDTSSRKLRDEVLALVVPFARLLDQPDGVAYLRLVGHLLANPRFSILDRHRSLYADRGILRAYQDVENRDPERWLYRRILITVLLFNGLADFARIHATKVKGGKRKPSTDAFVNELADAITLILEN